MTTMVSTTLKDRVSAKQLPAIYHTDASVKAFAGLNGLPAAAIITTTLNISTITDAAAGNYVFSYAAAFSIQAMPSGSCHHGGAHWMIMSPAPTTPTYTNTITCRVSTLASYHDCDYVALSSCGRLA